MADNSFPFPDKPAGSDLLTGFGKAALWSIPQWLGFSPPEDVKNWEIDHPYLGFAADMATTSIPYAGWFKASKGIKAFDAFIEGIGGAENASPFLTGFARTATRFAPLEAGRLGVNALVGSQGNLDMLASAGANTLLAGALGGVGGFLKAGGIATPEFRIPDDNVNLELPLRVRAVAQKITAGEYPPENLPDIQNVFAKLKEAARAEEVDAPRQKYVTEFDSTDKPTAWANMNSLFKPGEAGIVKRKLVVGTHGFDSEESWKNIQTQLGLPADFEGMGQFWRHLSYREGVKDSTMNRTENLLTEHLRPVGDNWFMGKEVDDGLYIMAKKLAGEPGLATKNDQWVIFKTDQPDTFARVQGNWLRGQINLERFKPEDQELNQDFGTIGNAIKDRVQSLPFNDYRVLASKRGVGGKFFDTLKKLTGVEAHTPQSVELFKRFQDSWRGYMSPLLYQFLNSPRAKWIMGQVHEATDAAAFAVDRLMYGEYKLKKSGKNLILATMRANKYLEFDKSVTKMVHDLTDEELGQVWKINNDNNIFGPDAIENLYTQGRISPNVRSVAKQLLDINWHSMDEINKARRAMGLSPDPHPEGHLGVPRLWPDYNYVSLRDQGGKLQWMANGGTRAQAETAAREALTKHPNWRIGEQFDVGQVETLPPDVKKFLRTAWYRRSRLQVGGYKWQEKPFTKQEFLDSFEQTMRYRAKYQAELVSKHLTSPEMTKLGRESPADYKMVQDRLKDFFQQQRDFSKIQNEVVDRVLGPYLGKNSATKIATETNGAMWHLSLGGVNLGHIITNLITPIQTVIPEIAFVLRAVPERVAGYYDNFASGGTRGVTGIVNVLSELKVMRQTFREMRNAPEDLNFTFQRGMNERLIAPRVAEEYIGSSSAVIGNLRAAASAGGFVPWLKAISEFLPAQSERMSRAFALTAGHIVGRDFLGLQGEELYQFAKQFHNKTMYLYTAADRPAAFNSPLGSTFGLFKNWMMHYMYSMAEYTGEGFAHGNWAPLLWQQAGTWAIGGLAASPLIQAGYAFNEMFSNRSLMENTYDAFGTNVADGIFYGLPPLLANVSLSSQASTPMSNPAHDAEQLFSFALWDRINYVGKTMGAAWDSWNATGENPAKDARVRDLMIRAFAPRTIYKLFDSIFAQGIDSPASGHPIMRDTSAAAKIAYAFGLTPETLQRTYDVSSILWSEKQTKLVEVQRLGSQYAEAMQRVDTESMRLILRKAQNEGLTSSVLASARRRYGADHRDLIERNFGADVMVRFPYLLD